MRFAWLVGQRFSNKVKLHLMMPGYVFSNHSDIFRPSPAPPPSYDRFVFPRCFPSALSIYRKLNKSVGGIATNWSTNERVIGGDL